MFINIRSKKDIDTIYIVLATFCWIMLNMCFLIRDMYADSKNIIMYVQYFGIMFTILGVLSLVGVGSIEKFKKL